MAVIADHAIKKAKMEGHVPAQYQQRLIRMFMAQYPHVLSGNFKGKAAAVVEKILVGKLSNKLTAFRRDTSGKAGVTADGEKLRLKSLKDCRPGVRSECLNPPGKTGFLDEEEDFRVQLIERFRQSDFGGETWYLWQKSQEYRRVDVQSCVWQTDPKTGFLYRLGLDEILERWPLLQHLVFLGADMDYLTDYEGSLNTATENYFSFMLRALLYYAKPNSGVNRYKSNAESMRRSGVQPVHFEMPYPVLMDLINDTWDGKHDIPTAANDVGMILRFIPIYGVFQRFSFWPIIRVPAGQEVKPPEHGLAIVETKTGRKVQDADVCTYSLYAEGVEVAMPDHELMTAVIGSFAAAYALHLPMIGQDLESLEKFRKLPNALQVLAKFLFQNEDGTGPLPEVLINSSAFHPQAVSLYNIISSVEENVNKKVVDLTEEDYDKENNLLGDEIEDHTSDRTRATPLQEQNEPGASKGKFKLPGAMSSHASRSESEGRASTCRQQSRPRDVSSEESLRSTPLLSDHGQEVPSRRRLPLNHNRSSSALGTLVRTETPAAAVMQRTPAVPRNRTPSSLSSASFGENLSQVSSGSAGTKKRGPTITSVAIRNTPIPRKNILIRRFRKKGNIDSDEDLVTGERDSVKGTGEYDGSEDEAHNVISAVNQTHQSQRKPVPRTMNVPSLAGRGNVEQDDGSPRTAEPAKQKRRPVLRCQDLRAKPQVPSNGEDVEDDEHIGEVEGHCAATAPLVKRRQPVPRIKKVPPQAEANDNDEREEPMNLAVETCDLPTVVQASQRVKSRPVPAAHNLPALICPMEASENDEWEEHMGLAETDHSFPPTVSQRVNQPPPPPRKYVHEAPILPSKTGKKKKPASESRKELGLKVSHKATRGKPGKAPRRSRKKSPESEDSDSDDDSYVSDDSSDSPEFATPEESDGHDDSDGYAQHVEACKTAIERDKEAQDAKNAQPQKYHADSLQIRDPAAERGVSVGAADRDEHRSIGGMMDRASSRSEAIGASPADRAANGGNASDEDAKPNAEAGKENRDPTSPGNPVTKLIPRMVRIKKKPRSLTPVADGRPADNNRPSDQGSQPFDSTMTTVPATPPRPRTRYSLKRVSSAAQQKEEDHVSQSQNASKIEIPRFQVDPLIAHYLGTLRATEIGESETERNQPREEASSNQSQRSPYRRSPLKKATRLTQ